MHQHEERRTRKERFALSVDLKFVLQGHVEAAGMLLDISESGLALISETPATEGDDIVVYPIGLGRLEGKVVRTFKGGMGVQFTLTPEQREIIKERLIAVLGGVPYMHISEKRSSSRVRHNIETYAYIDGEDEAVCCTIKDMSRTGCLLHSHIQPSIGSNVTLGALRGRVVRHVCEGFAMEFQRASSAARLDDAQPQETVQKSTRRAQA